MKRVSISLSDELFNKLDFYSKDLCMSRSQLMSFLIGQGLMSLDKSMFIIKNLGEISALDLLDSSFNLLKEAAHGSDQAGSV